MFCCFQLSARLYDVTAVVLGCAEQRLIEARCAADAAVWAMQKEVAADVEPPPSVDPKIAVMNLLQVLLLLSHCRASEAGRSYRKSFHILAAHMISCISFTFVVSWHDWLRLLL